MAFRFVLDQPPRAVPPKLRVQDRQKPGELALSLPQMVIVRAAMDHADLFDTTPDTTDAGAGIEYPALAAFADDSVNALGKLAARENELVARFVRAVPRPKELKGLTPAEADFVRAYRDVEDRAQGGRSADPDRVPGFKFGTNDGWWLQPAECEAIVRGLNRARAEDDVALMMSAGVDATEPDEAKAFRELLALFVDFNQLAAAHGGYRVR